MSLPLILILALITANLLISYKGFTDHSFLENYKFEVDAILKGKEYIRLISSGFLHIGWLHLLFNMLTLYAFGESLCASVGIFPFLLVYFGSLAGGNLLAMFIHKNHGDYSAVGASGAVCGVIFASIAVFPGMKVSLFILPIFVDSWIFGLLFMGLSLYGIKSKRDNIGHEAHLGGAVAGMILALLLRPEMLLQNYIPILVVLVPTVLFIGLIVYKPHLLLIDSVFTNTKKSFLNVEHKYNDQRVNQQKEIDAILEKISQKGIDSLNKKEREKLQAYSKR